MKKFQQNVGRELKRAYPDRRKLEAQVSQGHGHLLVRVTVIFKVKLGQCRSIQINLGQFGSI